MKNKCVFLDRDGVINRERGEYTFKVKDFEILPGVIEGLKRLKEAGYLLIVITNQAGISRGLYTRQEMQSCHDFLNEQTGCVIDQIYYSPYHPTVTESIARKPDSLMFEKAMVKFNIDPEQSWMVGDKERDLIPAKKLNMSTILVSEEQNSSYADYCKSTFNEVVEVVLS